MKKNLCLILSITLIFSAAMKTGTLPPDFELVRQRVIDQLMTPGVNDAQVKELVETLGKDGSWSDINYVDTTNTGFDHQRHLGNILVMSRAFRNENSGFHLDRSLKKSIILALEFWTLHDFICENWWWNQIGVPGTLVSIMLIMDKEIPVDLALKVQPIIQRGNINAWGARPGGDRIKIASIDAKNSLLLRNEQRFNEMIRIIEGEIKFVPGRGMQYDYSFHHRVDRVNNTLSYGLDYAGAFTEWAAYVADTRYAFSEEKTEQLIDYYLDGICKMMAYGKYPEPGAKNRSISRRGTLRPEKASIPEELLKTSNYRSEELEEIVAIRNNHSGAVRSHSTFYWQSEHYTHQRPQYFTSVRMYSTRNANMEEPYNSEGLLNHHRGDGTNHISRTGEEYQDIWPAYDWQKIPGTTVMQKPQLPPPEEIQKFGTTDFVGAVTDGLYGAAVFDFRSPHDPLEAKKAWFFFDKEYVCLGAGIKCPSGLPVYTTLNQCLLAGPVTALENKRQRTLEKGDHALNDAAWVYHDSTAYLFPGSTQVRLSNKTATGSWYDITKQIRTPRDKVSREVFSLWIDHGTHVEDASYQYIVVPSIQKEEIPDYIAGKNIEVISNTPEIQAVRHKGLGIYQLVFYKTGELQLSENLTLGSDSQGAIMLKTKGKTIRGISVSDPSRKLGKIHLSVNTPINKSGKNYTASWDEEKQITRLTIELPQGYYAGQSVSIPLP
ncbi:MAG: polysaccharide lyase family 8 super-sandwich domain-containing protein [Bacteroidota bacterium]